MRKSILIGVLAALMLFAFTACEQNMPSTPLYGAQVESITVDEQPVYIVGFDSEIDPTVIKFSVNYNDGKSYVYTGSQLGLTNDKPVSVTGLSNSVTVSIDDGKYTFYPIVKAYAPTGMTIDFSAEKPYEISSSTALAIDYKMTVASAGGPKDYSIEDEEIFDANQVEKLIADNNLEAGDSLAVTIDTIKAILGENADFDSVADIAEQYGFTIAVNGSFEVTVADPNATKINTIEVKQANKIYPVLKGMTVGTAKTKLSEAGLSIIAYDKDGVVLSASDTTGFTASYYDKDGVKFNNDYTWKEAGEYKVNVKYVKGDIEISGSFTLVVSEDYPTVYTVTQKGTEGADKDEMYQFEPTDPIDNMKYYDIKPSTWASGATAYTDEDIQPDYAAVNWTVAPSNIPADFLGSSESGKFAPTLVSNIEGVIANWAQNDGLSVVKERSEN